MNTYLKLRSFLLAFIAVMMASVGEAQVLLPNFRTADDFGGKNVGQLSRFVPTVDDYTLEVVATAGIPINIGFGELSYIPQKSGKVRFVQMSGKVYVFENNTYAATLTPTYSYTEGTSNLLRNGSFENVSEEMSTGRWKASDWDTWDGGTPTWGGDVGFVNVRENAKYRSDGTKSIILHSKSRWLCQQMGKGTLESGASYRLTCDYWTSEGSGNGDGLYQIWIGSSLANNDLMAFDAYTTSGSDNDKHSYSTIFQVPETLPSNVYFSFYRSVSKVDWLDNVKLVKITPAKQGITGVSSAVYGRGAYAPKNMSLPDNAAVDFTGSIVNPNFDNATMVNGAPTGWTLDGKVTQSKISTGAKGDGIIAANQNHWQIWHDGSALTGRAYQRLTNMPNGKYEVTASVVTTGFGGKINLFANYGTTAVASNAGKQYMVTGVVVDGNLDFGLDFATTGGVTVDYDSFTLLYKGMDAEGYREVLTIKVADAEKQMTNLEEGYDSTPIKKAVADAKALAEDADAEAVIAAIAEIDKALADYQNYVAEREAERKKVAAFSSMLTSAKAERKADAYPGTTAFDTAITKADAFFAKLTATPSLDVTEEQDALNAAREAYYNSQFTVAPVKQTVSYVDLSLNGSEKYVLRVDGKPFYPTEIQVRPDKLRGYEGWSEAEIEAAFKRAADDGFNALSVPVFWSEVEPEKNHFDWRILDNYMALCKKYGVKMELLWFSWSSGGRVQYLWNYNGKQQLRTPDYVCSMDGTSEFNMLRKQWEYSLDWRDTNLRSRDAYVLGRVMEHVALWDANNNNSHTVIGVQLGNEARAHGGNSASDAEIIDYYHHVGAAVKNSKYVTWTRLNCVSWETIGRTNANENKRNNGGTNIDFVGVDVYGTNTGAIKGDINGWLGVKGKNFRMIMEIDAKDANSPIYQLAALAGDKAFDYYNLGPVDGNGLYSNNGHVLAERSHINLVRQRNKVLNMANQDIALYKQGGSLYVYNYAGSTTNSETGLDGISFVPGANTTQAVAVRHDNGEIVLLSTAPGTFTLPASLSGYKAEYGYFDKNNKWVKQGDVTITDNKVKMTTTAPCVLLTKISHDKKRVQVFTCGDSTMANKSSKTERGWGMLFPTFVDDTEAAVINKAEDGRSTLSFINEGRWQAVADQLTEGDYVLLQFGHNDEKTDASLHTDPQTTYKANLRRFITETRAKGANPVLLTPIVRRIFGADGNIEDEHTEYAEAVRELAKEQNVPLIDMNVFSNQYENIAGVVGSRALHEYFPSTEIDNTHLCQLGAYVTARCVAEQIAANKSIEIPLKSNPEGLDGAYASTLDYAQNMFSATYSEEKAPATLAAIDERVRALRFQARQDLKGVLEPTDATFALVNPGFDEGMCWYNAVQATRPMGWTMTFMGTANPKLSSGAKPQDAVSPIIASGQDHLQVWGIGGSGKISQNVENLADGRYEVSVAFCRAGSISIKLFANDAEKNLDGNGIYKVETEVKDGKLTLGVSYTAASGATIDMDAFTLTKLEDTSTGIGDTKLDIAYASDACYDLMGRKVNPVKKGFYIINGKKVIR